MQGLKNNKIVLYCSRLFVPLTMSKVLPLDNKNEKNYFSFCIVLAYSYLCSLKGVLCAGIM